MVKLRTYIIRGLMVLSFAALPGAGVECELDDGELEIDLDGIDLDFDHGHHYDFYYEDWFFWW
jgi:hypothetical protein